MRGAALAALAIGVASAVGVHTYTAPLLRGWTPQPHSKATKKSKRAASRTKQKARRTAQRAARRNK
jgi:hypothetical protein